MKKIFIVLAAFHWMRLCRTDDAEVAIIADNYVN